MERALARHDRLPAELEAIRVHSLRGHSLQSRASSWPFASNCPWTTPKNSDLAAFATAGSEKRPDEQRNEGGEPHGARPELRRGAGGA